MTIAGWTTGMLRESMRMHVIVSGWSLGRRSRIRMHGLRKFLGAARSVRAVEAERRVKLRKKASFRSCHSRWANSNAGEGYTLEGRYAVHCREDDMTMYVSSYQPSGDRRDRYGRTRCPFDPPREREPLRFDL